MNEHVAPAHSKVGTITETPHDGGRPITSDLVCCVHCGYIWVFRPGSGKRRGFCYRCNGFLCGHAACVALGCRHWMHDIENMEKGRPEGTRPVAVSVPRIILGSA
jgi:hypothetical protein